MQTTAPQTVDALTIAQALYVQARDQYRAALNAAAAVTCAGPNTRTRLIGALDRAAASHRMAVARLDLMLHPGPDAADLANMRD